MADKKYADQKYADIKYADTKYADTKYLTDPTQGSTVPDGPVAVPRLVRGDDGLVHTVYIDPSTGEKLSNLNGYTIISSDGGVYKVTSKDDENKDGAVDVGETSRRVEQALGGHTNHEDANGHTPGPAGSVSNNFGYHSKPSGLGIAGAVGGLINPGIGAAIGVLGKGYNVSNMEAANSARKMLGLSPLSPKQMMSQAMKDNKGQIARVEMGNNKQYSIGFEALSPTGVTNLTPDEASKRAAMFGMKEVADNTKKSTVSKMGSKISKALGIEPGVISKSLETVGLDKGFATKALNNIFGVTPPTAPTPAPSPTARPENMATVTPGASSATKAKSVSGAGLISHPNNPNQNTQDNKNAPANVNYSGIGPGRNVAPEKSFMTGIAQAASKVLGPTAQVDVSSGTYSDEQREHINRAREEAAAQPGATAKSIAAAAKAAGQVGSTRHTTAKAVDFGVSFTDPTTGKRVNATPEQMADVAAAYTKENPEAGVGLGQGYMDEDGRARAHIDATGQAGVWGAGGLSANASQALKETIGAVREGYNPTPFSNAPTPSSAPSKVSGFVSQDERAEDTGNVRNSAVDSVRSQLGLGQVPDNVGAPSVSSTGVTTSKAFQSQDEKSNTGSIKNAAPANNFTSQDERESLASRMGITNAVGNSLDPGKSVSKVTGPVDSQASVGAKTVANSVQSKPGVADAKIGYSGAAMAAMGLTARTTQEKAAMAKAIAGELSQGSLKALSNKDPKALAEVGNMIATMENRAVSKQYGTIAKTLAPSQYNSLMASNMAVTNQNYAANKAAIEAAQKAFYSGQPVPGVNYDATNYHAVAMSNPPGWSAKMTDPTVSGAHLFGALPGYGADAAQRAAATAMSTMAGTNYSPGKQKDDTPGAYSGSGTGTTFGGSAGQSGGAGYSPGGMNSPSGSTYGGYGGGNYGGSTSYGGGSGYGSGSGGQGTASGGGAGMSGGGGYSPGGMGSPSGSGFGGSSSSSGGFGGQGSPRGVGSPSSGSSSSGAGGGMNGSGSSAGAQSRSDGWN